MTTLAQQIFAVAPARGRQGLSAAQEALLAGKALWLHEAHKGGFAVVPTIVVTRAAWVELQAERARGGTRLRTVWVATLFRLVGLDGVPPPLVVRTSAPRHSGGLMAARLSIPAPGSEAEAVDPSRPLAEAIADAFESYAAAGPAWTTSVEESDSGSQIVLVQALVEGDAQEFHTRDLQSGHLKATPVARGTTLVRPDDCLAIARVLDAVAGQHMCCATIIEPDGLRLVSARPVQASVAADLHALVERVEQGVWSPRQAVASFDPNRLVQALHPRLKAEVTETPLATGLGVSPGAASGQIVFTAEDAARVRARGHHCILVAVETGPADVEGMRVATGILTARGGMTSHAAVIARITGKPCVAAVRSLEVDLAELRCRIGGRAFAAGDRITIDGSDGNVFAGALPLSQPQLSGAIGRLLAWSDANRMIGVRTNVETVEAAKTALSFGAEGIGLARSEHMFLSPARMVALRRLILSENENDRAQALDGLVDYQTGDYAALFGSMHGKPVTVRLFDPPLHEFLPRTDEDIADTARSLGLDIRALRLRLDRLSEVNPILGHRGVRLAITYPEILDMQIRAVIAGAKAAADSQTEPVNIEIMVPFVSSASEVNWIRAKVLDLLDRSRLLASNRVLFSFGTMIELPRAALRAGDMATAVDFFSFGTNDLTQTTWGISRDDAPAFMAAYQRKGLIVDDPFVTIDRRGVGEFIAMAIERGKAANPQLKIGICGEHAGDPASLAFFATLPIDYVSCSPYRVPIARLALAQAR